MAASPTTSKVGLEWIELRDVRARRRGRHLEDVHGILVPGGFGERGTEGKIAAVPFARERNVPFFGICFGMQMAVIEAARNLLGLEGAVVDRVRPVRAAGRRPDDGMDARATSSRSARPTATSAAPCGWAPIRRHLRPGSKVHEIYGAT